MASACFYVRTCRRVRNSKKIATIRDFNLPGSFLCLSTRLLRQLLVAPKDKPLPDQLAGTVYCLECEDCHKYYIGESARPRGKRIKEHITTSSSSTSAVSELLKTVKHHFDPDKVKILAREPKDFSRKSCKLSTSERRSPPSIETRG